ncbi:MAG: Clp protease N-terminal domain-containing protein [Catenulispora sp.]
MLGTFTPEARQVVAEAHHEAHRLGHSFLGCEHLLLAAGGTEGVAGEVLRRQGLTPTALRATLRRLLPDGGPRLDGAALADIGIDLDAVRSRVEAAFGVGALDRRPAGTGRRRRLPVARNKVTGHLPPTTRVIGCLELSQHEAADRGRSRVGVDDLVLALTTTPGPWRRIVTDLGADLAAVRAELLRG